MSKSKKLFVLLGVLLVVCVATFAISRYETKKEEIRNSDEVILTIDADTVSSLSWKYGSEELGFHKDETWLYDEDEAFPVNEEKIDELLNVFKEFGVSFAIENVEDYGQYGLDDPMCTINISAGDTEYKISLGDYSAMDSERYISIGDGNVYLASHDPYDDYELVISDMIQHDEIPSLADATEIQFSGSEAYSIRYEEESDKSYCPDDVYFTEDKPLDTSSVSSYLSLMSSLSITDYVSYNVTDEELASFGLDTPELTVTVNYPFENEDEETEERTFVLNVGRNQEELKEALESDEENAEDNVTAYVRVGDSQIIYRITSLNYENLMKASYDDLRHKEVLTASFDDIYQIDITLEGENYSITSETSEDNEDERVWHYKDDEELELASLRNAIKGLSADSFTEETPTGKEEISFTVYLDNEKYPQVEVSLYRYDGSSCIAVVDGKPVSKVPRSQVVDLIEAVNAIVLN